MASVRFFSAVGVAPTPAMDLRGRQTSLRSSANVRGLRLRWEDPAKWHITLAFYGHASERRVLDLRTRLTRAARRADPFSIALGRLGAFAQPRSARVLWAGMASPSPGLHRLAAATAAAGRRAGLSEDAPHRYRPHLTLARASTPTDLTALLEDAGAWPTHPGPEWQVSWLDLLASTPLRSGGGTRYEVVDRFPLGRT